MVQWQLAFTLCICTNLAILFCVYAQTQEINAARIETLPAYAIASKADFLNSTTCGKELRTFRDAVDQRILWSLKVLDSSGEFKPGFLYGNNFWLGSRSQCLDTMNDPLFSYSDRKILMLNNMQYHDPQKKIPPFQINYFVAHFRHNSIFQHNIKKYYEDVITLGLCLPASCTSNNLSFILEKIFSDRVLLIKDLYFADFHLIQVKDLKDDNEWITNATLLFICIGLGLSFLMTTIGTIYDIFVHQKCVKKNEINKTNDGVKNEEIETRITKINSSLYQESKIGRVLICFSAYTNTRKIFNTKLNTDTIPVIHGLKFFSMCLIISSHCLYFTIDLIDNKVWLWRIMKNYSTFLSAFVIIAVDVFFFLSGCLTTYLYLKDETNKILIKSIGFRQKLIKLFFHIIKRYIRLTSVYVMVLGIWHLSLTWFDKTSQFYIYERSHETCAKYWWRNLLYINNLFGVDAMCMKWTWYLANDMQFYLITVTLLTLSITHFYAAVAILSGLLIGSVILSGYISYVYEFVITPYELNRLADIIYIAPWMRIIPCIIGIIAGYILAKLNNNLILKKKIIILYWFLAGACNISILLFLLDNQYLYMSVLATSIYVALHRIFWAIGIAWIVIACSTKHGGIVNQLLSFKGWIPFSRLTYCAYLLHPVIIRSISLYHETSIHFEVPLSFVSYVGYIVITYFSSYVLSLMVEIPCILLIRMFIEDRNKMQKLL